METLFVVLYPLVAVLATVGYLPQIIRLLRAQCPEDKMSLLAWGTWVITYAISLGYGVFHLQDTMYIVVTALGLVCICIICLLLLYNRHVRFRKSAQ